MKFQKFTYGVDFTYHNDQIALTPAGVKKVKKVKKITGSRIGGVLGVDSFNTPFQVWCDLLGFYVSEGDDFFLNAGKIIEPKLKAYCEQQTQLTFHSYEPKKIHYDLFQTNKIFGGIPDGEPVDHNHQITYAHNWPMLEIKTASVDQYEWTKVDNELRLVYDQNNLPIIKSENTKLTKWINHQQLLVPLNYQYQLGLYMYLRQITHGLFCIGFLKTQDYLHPEAYDPNDPNNLIVLEQFHLDLVQFQKVIDYVTSWHQAHIDKWISPKMTEGDLAWFSYGYPQIRT